MKAYSVFVLIRSLLLMLVSAWFFPLAACSNGPDEAAGESMTPAGAPGVGVLLISHGSRSQSWREMLLDVETAVRNEILAHSSVSGVRTAFMEYSEPSIASQLKAFDEENVTDVILVPLLLRVSSHSFDDIPTIIGHKEDALSIASLRSEGVARYTPRARVTMTPLLDYGGLLLENVARRVKALSIDLDEEGVVLVAYGSKAYESEWESFLDTLSGHLRETTGIKVIAHAWCGHIVRYSRQPTIDAIAEVMTLKERVLVIPLLVAEDERFQGEIIGGAVHDSGFGDRVVYKPDSVLPDENLNRWVVGIVAKTLKNLETAPSSEGG